MKDTPETMVEFLIHSQEELINLMEKTLGVVAPSEDRKKVDGQESNLMYGLQCAIQNQKELFQIMDAYIAKRNQSQLQTMPNEKLSEDTLDPYPLGK